MGLNGNLRTMSLPDILQWIAMGQKTGTLKLDRQSIQKRVTFQDGLISTSWSNDPREALGQFLVRDGLISEEQLFRVLLQQESRGRPIGVLLVEDGTLSADALRQVLRCKAEETIYDLFLWPEGEFRFKEGEIPADTGINIGIGVTEVILEGIRRVDEWERIRKEFPSSAVTFVPRDSPDTVSDPVDEQALALVRAGKDLATIALELRRSEFDAAFLLFDLYARGFIAVVPPANPATPAADPIVAIRDLLAAAYQKLQEKRYDAATKTYEEVLALDRLNQHAKKGLLSVAEARARERARRRVPMDKVPFLNVDFQTLTRENFDPQEGFVLSRVNGEWDVQSILKICPMSEEDALLIFARLLDRKVIELR